MTGLVQNNGAPPVVVVEPLEYITRILGEMNPNETFIRLTHHKTARTILVNPSNIVWMYTEDKS